MIANYHAHTWRCNHASGTEREYIEEAIRGGYKIFGFSDHTPYPFSKGYESTFRMHVNQLDEYCHTLEELRKEYASDIEIHIGLETEYYPKYFPRLQELLKGTPVEYLLMGQHYLNNEMDDYPCTRPTVEESRIRHYVEQVEEGLSTGCFAYLAHPDVLRFEGDPAVYDKWMRRLIRFCVAKEIPLEVNFLGIWDNRHYPNPVFWDIAAEEGATAIYGVDAHRTDKIWLPETLEKAEKFGKKRNMKRLQTLELKLQEVL